MLWLQNRNIRLYKKAWLRSGEGGPLSYDCGSLCDRKCCSGTESDGMLLFPGEEYLYLSIKNNWFGIKDSDLCLSDGYKIKYLVCNGSCPREYRPLSCRIFPLIPYINEFGRMDFRLDLRSLGICPIVFSPNEHMISESFIEKLYLTFPPLLKKKAVVEFIEILSRQYDEMAVFLNRINGAN